MPSLSPKDRVSLCQFTFADGRRCRSHRFGSHPRFCPDHAQKEARARAVENLGRDLDYFFSADYLSACDLTTALGRLIPAVIRGDVKPRTARTVAYLSQTLLQAMRMAQDEYISVFGTDGWRKSIRNSINTNYDHRYPSTPSEAEGPTPTQPASPQPQPAPTPVAHSFRGEPVRPVPPPQPPETTVNYHSDAAAQAGIYPDRVGRPAEPAPSSNSSLATHHSPLPPAPPPQTPLPPTATEFAQHVMAARNLSQPNHPTSTTDQTPPTCATQSAPSTVPTPPPACPEPDRKDTPPTTAPPTPKPEPFLDARAYHYDHTYTLYVDGKPF